MRGHPYMMSKKIAEFFTPSSSSYRCHTLVTFQCYHLPLGYPLPPPKFGCHIWRVPNPIRPCSYPRYSLGNVKDDEGTKNHVGLSDQMRPRSRRVSIVARFIEAKNAEQLCHHFAFNYPLRQYFYYCCTLGYQRVQSTPSKPSSTLLSPLPIFCLKSKLG